MTDAARKMRNEYAKQWRKKNKDKVKATQQAYWERKAAAAAAERDSESNGGAQK